MLLISLPQPDNTERDGVIAERAESKLCLWKLMKGVCLAQSKLGLDPKNYLWCPENFQGWSLSTNMCGPKEKKEEETREGRKGKGKWARELKGPKYDPSTTRGPSSPRLHSPSPEPSHTHTSGIARNGWGCPPHTLICSLTFQNSFGSSYCHVSIDKLKMGLRLFNWLLTIVYIKLTPLWKWWS